MNRVVAVLLLATLVAGLASASGPRPEFEQYRAVQESLSRVPPRLRAEWLNRRGLTLPPWNAPLPTTSRDDSLGLRLVGKWGRGPAYEVTGQGSLVALTLGSEVALLDFANPDSPVVLSEIQLDLIPRQSALHGSYLVTSDDGIEFWDITDPRAPVYRRSIPYTVGDFAIADTFLFFIRGDTFHAYNIANPLNPYQLGTCVEGGYVTAATRNVAVVRAPGDVMDFIDVSNPATPFRAGTYPSFALGAAARGNICCANIYWSTDYDHFRFEVLDISDPANVHRIGAIDSVGGWDVHLSGPLAFVSGFQLSEYEFTIVSLADSTSPQVVSACATPSHNYGVWADWMADYSYVADMTGLAVVDISDLNAPVLDTVILKAGEAYDVAVNGAMAYVADYRGGLRVLDVSDPAKPVELGGRDSTVSACYSAAARDSFVYVGWQPNPYFRTMDVTDPSSPRLAATCPTFDIPVATVIRDSFVYCAERLRFQVVNVARPREPVVVGTCSISDMDWGDVELRDSLAFVAFWPSDIINVADPAHPVRIGAFQRGADNLAVKDTLAYLVGGGLYVYSVANPASPRLIDSLCTGFQAWSIALVETLAYVGCRDAVRLMDVSDPHNIRVIASHAIPATAWKMTYAAPYVYVACFDAGVCIFDTVAVGVAEPERPSVALRQVPFATTVTRDVLLLELSEESGRDAAAAVYDVSGSLLMSASLPRQGRAARLSLARASAGVYVVKVTVNGQVSILKVVKF